MCVYVHMSNKSRVGRSALIFFFFFFIGKTGNSRSGIRYFIFKIFGKPSFVEAVLWRVAPFFYLLCSQFRQKASSWINKTLLLIKQQKWLFEFCVKIDRVDRVTVNTHIFVLSILTDFSFFGPDSSWDSCKFDEFFRGWGMHFWQRNKKCWKDPGCVNSRIFSVFVQKNTFTHDCVKKLSLRLVTFINR